MERNNSRTEAEKKRLLEGHELEAEDMLMMGRRERRIEVKVSYINLNGLIGTGRAK